MHHDVKAAMQIKNLYIPIPIAAFQAFEVEKPFRVSVGAEQGVEKFLHLPEDKYWFFKNSYFIKNFKNYFFEMGSYCVLKADLDL